MQRRYYALHKPYGYLSQFTDEGKWKGLNQLIDVSSDVYSVGRLDAESEGLLLLTNDTSINQQLLHPKNQHSRTYLVQVDGEITEEAVRLLNSPLEIKINKKPYRTLTAVCKSILDPTFIKERIPPIRVRQSIPTSWIELTLMEGKNRQVRKMTALVGFPTLRLIRSQIESLDLHLNQGELKEYEEKEFKKMLQL